jgi:L-ribulose-5-phosphate 4-epimerase
MAASGLARGTSGNMSARDPKSGYIVIKPSGIPYGDLRPVDMVVLDAHGEFIDGRRRPSTEYRMHLRVYVEMRDVFGIVHAHSPTATAYAVARRPLRIALAEGAAVFGPVVPLAPYATTGTEALGRAAALAMKTKKTLAALLESHGTIAVGASVEEAFANALHLEETARIQLLAETLGGAAPLSASECRRIRRRYLDNYGQRPR